MTTSQLLTETIDMFLEYRDKHGYQESEAKTKAVLEIMEGINSTAVDELLEDQTRMRSKLTSIVRTLEQLEPKIDSDPGANRRFNELLKESAKLEVSLGY